VNEPELVPVGQPVVWNEEVHINNAQLVMSEFHDPEGKLVRELIFVVGPHKAFRVKFDANGCRLVSEFLGRPDIQVAQQIPDIVMPGNKHG
jgi:hypothetical protein